MLRNGPGRVRASAVLAMLWGCRRAQSGSQEIVLKVSQAALYARYGLKRHDAPAKLRIVAPNRAHLLPRLL